MYINGTPMAVAGATQALEALKVGVAYLLQFMEPEDLLQALLQLAVLKGLPIDEDEFRSLLEMGDEMPDEVIRTG
jgi:hypothetical protein